MYGIIIFELYPQIDFVTFHDNFVKFINYI